MNLTYSSLRIDYGIYIIFEMPNKATMATITVNYNQSATLEIEMYTN